MKLNDKLSVLFLLEGSKICSDGKMPIYVRITVVGSPRAEMSLGRKVYPHEWDQENERVIVNSKNKELAIINTIIQNYKAKLETDFFVLNSQFKTISSQMVKRRFLGSDEKEEEEKQHQEQRRQLEEIRQLKEKQHQQEKKGFDLDVFQQIDEYIQLRKGKVDDDTIAVYEK